MRRFVSRDLDLLTTQHASGHDQRVTNAHPYSGSVAGLRLARPTAQLFLAIPDYVFQDAGVRCEDHCCGTVPSSDIDTGVRPLSN